MQSEIKVGQRFKFNILSDNHAPERLAVVTRVLSDKEEGLGPEAEVIFRLGTSTSVPTLFVLIAFGGSPP